MAVTVLGKTFENEKERREYFRDELRKKLPELKKMEGFPIGEDEDIIELSDPPYYTACPNPWINDIIDFWEAKKEDYIGREEHFEIDVPVARDVSEGKSNKIYNAHSYHTKIPHPAIMRYILHYTQPGDIIFDGFAGTGMAGVAANQCNSPTKEQKAKMEAEWKENYGETPRWGNRNAILTDLSPLCSFISFNLNSKFSIEDFLTYSNQVLENVWNEVGWMYETNHKNLGKGKIIYTVWSAVYKCPECQEDMLYWDASMNNDKTKQTQNLTCPNCGAVTIKRNCEPKIESYYDDILSEPKEKVKEVPVMISYEFDGSRYEKKPDQNDLKVLEEINHNEIQSFIPKEKIMGKGKNWGDTYRSGYHTGITHYHHLYTKKNIFTIATIYKEIKNLDVDERLKKALLFWFSSSQNRLDKTNRYSYNHSRHVGPLSNTLYISATPAEISPFYFFNSKRNHFKKLKIPNGQNITQVGDSATLNNIRNESVDYLFIDPPYGDNIPYAELNSVLESWLRVKTEIESETIVSKKQGKGLYEYQDLLSKSFRQFFRILKPGKWMTVVFSNTEAAVWNVIQNSINQAGFVVSNVSAIDTSRPGLHGIIGPVAVRQPLVISCFKPTETFTKKFQSDSESTIWEFVEEYLTHLPIHVVKNDKSTAIIERSPKILYDRLVAYYVQKNLPVPIDAGKFQKELKERFIDRDGMYFTNEQVQEYDRKKAEVPNFTQLSILVASEQDGVLWLRNFLKDEPKTYQDIYNDWIQALGGERKGDIIPELKTILEENFLQDSDGEWYVPDPENEEDLEKLRNRRLLKQFEEYKELAFKPKGKIKECRVEALRAGFKQSYQEKDFETIVRVGDRIPNNLLMEDEVLLQFYDIAAAKV